MFKLGLRKQEKYSKTQKEVERKEIFEILFKKERKLKDINSFKKNL